MNEVWDFRFTVRPLKDDIPSRNHSLALRTPYNVCNHFNVLLITVAAFKINFKSNFLMNPGRGSLLEITREIYWVF